MVEDKLEYANIDFALVISGEYGDEPLHLLVSLRTLEPRNIVLSCTQRAPLIGQALTP